MKKVAVCLCGFLLLLVVGFGQIQGQTVIFREDFEGAFPGDWVTGFPDSAAPVFWSGVDLRSFGTPAPQGVGVYAAYCAGSGFRGTPGNPRYANDMESYLARTVDLRGYSAATLTFRHIIPSLQSLDRCEIFFGEESIYSTTDIASAWRTVTVDLTSHAGTFGFLSFVFFSDESVNFEGWYVDDIVITGITAPTQPQLFEPALSGGRFRVRVATQSGVTYHFEKTDTLSPPAWGTVQTITGNGGIMELTDNSATGFSRFYRVRVQ